MHRSRPGRAALLYICKLLSAPHQRAAARSTCGAVNSSTAQACPHRSHALPFSRPPPLRRLSPDDFSRYSPHDVGQCSWGNFQLRTRNSSTPFRPYSSTANAHKHGTVRIRTLWSQKALSDGRLHLPFSSPNRHRRVEPGYAGSIQDYWGPEPRWRYSLTPRRAFVRHVCREMSRKNHRHLIDNAGRPPGSRICRSHMAQTRPARFHRWIQVRHSGSGQRAGGQAPTGRGALNQKCRQGVRIGCRASTFE